MSILGTIRAHRDEIRKLHAIIAGLAAQRDHFAERAKTRDELLAALELVLFAVTNDVTTNNGAVDLAGIEDTVRAALAKAKPTPGDSGEPTETRRKP